METCTLFHANTTLFSCLAYTLEQARPALHCFYFQMICFTFNVTRDSGWGLTNMLVDSNSISRSAGVAGTQIQYKEGKESLRANIRADRHTVWSTPYHPPNSSHTKCCSYYSPMRTAATCGEIWSLIDLVTVVKLRLGFIHCQTDVTPPTQLMCSASSHFPFRLLIF